MPKHQCLGRERFMQGHATGMAACAQKAPELPHGFQKSIYKDQVREGCPRVCDQPMCNSLIG